jgi:hypothetical protein
MSKAKQKLIHVPGDAMLKAIGLVAIKWAILEQRLNNKLFWATDPANKQDQRLLARGSLRQR